MKIWHWIDALSRCICRQNPKEEAVGTKRGAEDRKDGEMFWFAVILLMLWSSFLLISEAPAQAQADGAKAADSVLGATMVLDAYVAEEDGNVLVTGYLPSADSLNLPGGVEHEYESDSGQIYALGSMLEQKDGDRQALRLESSGQFGQVHALVHLPPGSHVVQLSGSDGISRWSLSDSDEVTAEFLGYDLTDPWIDCSFILPKD
ncbi:MAG: hypothetical protein A4E45_01633 [Methanosaeta sp. PtaB.Bin039]|nr:MAG: hypothetical protein A4E45_01633 [Methanosaeta sp. PtaB.Bin039]